MKSVRSIAPVSFVMCVVALTFSMAFTPGFGTLTFRISGMESSKGVVRVALYDNDKNFLSEFGFAAADSAFAHANGTVDVVIHNVPFGTYAAAIYQDENQNGVIDQNMIKIPTEPYAFSNGVYAKWSVPSFKEVAFQFEQPNVRLEAVLRSWSKQ